MKRERSWLPRGTDTVPGSDQGMVAREEDNGTYTFEIWRGDVKVVVNMDRGEANRFSGFIRAEKRRGN